MEDIICLKLFKTRKRNNKNRIYTILPNENNDVIALLYFKNNYEDEKSFKLCFNFLNNYSNDCLLNNNTISCFWVYSNIDIFIKKEKVKRQIPILISQQNNQLNFYNFIYINKINPLIENHEIKIQDNVLNFSICEKIHENIAEKNKLYNFYISIDKLFHFAISLNKNLSILESFNKKFVKIILNKEDSFFIILNDIVCLKFATYGQSLKIKNLFALQNILMNIDNYIYFQKCISKSNFLFLLTLTPQQFLLIYRGDTPYLAININKYLSTFFVDFEVSHDLLIIILFDINNQLWFLNLNTYCNLNFTREENKNKIILEKEKIKNVVIHSLNEKQESYYYLETKRNTKHHIKENVEKGENLTIQKNKNNVKFNFESYFPNFFKLREIKAYIKKDLKKDKDCIICIKNYKKLESSKYIYIIKEIKKKLKKENFYQISNYEKLNKKKYSNYRKNYHILYFYKKKELSDYYIDFSYYNNYDCKYQTNKSINNLYDYKKYESNGNTFREFYYKSCDHYFKDKYNIPQNDEIYKNIVNERIENVDKNDLKLVKVCNGNENNYNNEKDLIKKSNDKKYLNDDFFFINNNYKNYHFYNVVNNINNNTNIYDLINLNLDKSVNNLNNKLPQYIQYIHVYKYFYNIRRFFVIKKCKDNSRSYSRYKNTNRNSKNFLFNKKLQSIKIYVCNKYFMIEIFLSCKNKCYLIVLKIEEKIKFLFILKNYKYFYVNNKSHPIFNIDNTLCKLIFKSCISTLIDIITYNKKTIAEKILKVNNLKKSYLYFIMIYNSLLNKDIYLIKKCLKILKFKEALLLCRILFHYILNNFNMKLIYFYFINYFSFINHVLNKRDKKKIHKLKKEIKKKKEFISIYMKITLKKIFDIVDIIAKKYLCFQDNNESKFSFNQEIFNKNEKKLKENESFNLYSNKKKPIKVQISNMRKKERKFDLINSNMNNKNMKEKLTQSTSLKKECLVKDSFNHINEKRDLDENKINNNSGSIIKNNFISDSKENKIKMNELSINNIKSNISGNNKNVITSINDRRIIHNYNNINNKYLKIYEIYYFEKNCFCDNYNLFLNKKYSIEICSITIHFIISFIDYFIKKKKNSIKRKSKKFNKIFIEMNKYIYFIKILMNALLNNYSKKVKKRTKRNRSKNDISENEKYLVISNNCKRELNFFNSIYLNVYNFYDIILQTLYIKTSNDDKINKFILNVDNNFYNNNEKVLDKNIVVKNKRGSILNYDSFIKNNNYNEKKLLNNKNSMSDCQNLDYILKNNDTNGTPTIRNKENINEINEKNNINEKIDTNNNNWNKNNIRNYDDFLFLLCYCYIVFTRKKKRFTYFPIKNIFYKEIVNSNSLIKEENDFNTIVYNIVNNNDLSTIIYYIYSKKYEFFFNFIFLYFNYCVLYNFFINRKNKCIKKLYHYMYKNSMIDNNDKMHKDRYRNGNCEDTDKKKKNKQKKLECNLFFNKMMISIINNNEATSIKEKKIYNYNYNYNTLVNYLFNDNKENRIIYNNNSENKNVINNRMSPSNNYKFINTSSMRKNNYYNLNERMNNSNSNYYNKINSCNNKLKLKNVIFEIYKMYDNLDRKFIKLENKINIKNIDSIFSFQFDVKNLLKSNLYNIILLIYKLIIKNKNKNNSYFKENIFKLLIKNLKIPFSYIHLAPYKILINYYGGIIYRLLCNNINNYLNICIYIVKILCIDVLKFFKMIAFNTLKKYIRNNLLLFLLKNNYKLNTKDKRAVKLIAILEIFYKNSSYSSEHNSSYTNYILNRNYFNLYQNETFLDLLKKKLYWNKHIYVHDMIYKEKNILSIFNYLNIYSVVSDSFEFVNYFNHTSYAFVAFLIQNFFCFYKIGNKENNKRDKNKLNRIKIKSKLKDIFLKKMNPKSIKRIKLVIMKKYCYFKIKQKILRNKIRIVKKIKRVIEKINESNKEILLYNKLTHHRSIKDVSFLRDDCYFNLDEYIRIHKPKINDIYIQNIEKMNNQRNDTLGKKKSMNNNTKEVERIQKKDKECLKIIEKEIIQKNMKNINNIKDIYKTNNESNLHNINCDKKYFNKFVNCYFTNKKNNKNIITLNIAKQWLKLKGEDVDDIRFISYNEFSSNIVKEKNKIKNNLNKMYLKKDKGYYDINNYDNECYCYLCCSGKKEKEKIEANKNQTESFNIDYNYSNVDTIDDFVLHNNQIIENISDAIYKDKRNSNEKNVHTSYIKNTFIFKKVNSNEKNKEINTLQNSINKSINTLHEDEKENKVPFKNIKSKYENTCNYRLIQCEISNNKYLCHSLFMLKTINKSIMVRIVLENKGINYLFFLMKYFINKKLKSFILNKKKLKNEYKEKRDIEKEKEKKKKNYQDYYFKSQSLKRDSSNILVKHKNEYMDYILLKKNNRDKITKNKNIKKNQEILNKNPIYKCILLKDSKKKKIIVKNLFYEIIKIFNIKSYDYNLFVYILEYYIDNNNISALFIHLLTLNYFTNNFFKTLHRSSRFNFYKVIKIKKSKRKIKKENNKYNSMLINENDKSEKKYFISENHRKARKIHTLNIYEKNFLKIIRYIQTNLGNKSTKYIYDYVEHFLESHGIFLFKFDFLYKLKILNICPSNKRTLNYENLKIKVLDIISNKKFPIKLRERKYKSDKYIFASKNIRTKKKKNKHIYYNMMIKLSRNFLCFNYLSYQNINYKFNVNISFGNVDNLLGYNKKYIMSNEINNLHNYILNYFLINQSYTSMYFFILKNNHLFRKLKDCNYLIKKLYKKENNFHIINNSANLYLFIPCYIYSQLSNNMLSLSLYNCAVISLQELKKYIETNIKENISKNEFLNISKDLIISNNNASQLKNDIDKSKKGTSLNILADTKISEKEREVENTSIKYEKKKKEYNIVIEKDNAYNFFLKKDKNNINYISLYNLSFLSVKLFFCLFVFSNIDIFDFKKNKCKNPLYMNIYYFKKLTKCFSPSIYEAYFGCKQYLKKKIKAKLEKEKIKNKKIFKLAIENLKKYKENYVHKKIYNYSAKNYSYNFCFENLYLIKEMDKDNSNNQEKDKYSLVKKVTKHKNVFYKNIYKSRVEFYYSYDFFTYNNDLSLQELLEKTVDQTFFQAYFSPFSIFKNIFEKKYQDTFNSEELINYQNNNSKKKIREDTFYMFCNNSLKENKILHKLFNYEVFFVDLRKYKNEDNYIKYILKNKSIEIENNTINNRDNRKIIDYNVDFLKSKKEDNSYPINLENRKLDKNYFYFLKYFNVKYFLICCQPLIAYHILIINHIFYDNKKTKNLLNYLYTNNYDVKFLNNYLINNNVNLPLNLKEDLKKEINDMCLELSIFYFNNNNILCSVFCFLDLCNINIEKLKMYILSMKSIYYCFKKNYRKRNFFDKWIKKCFQFFKIINFSIEDFYKMNKNIFYENFSITDINYYDLFKKNFIELIVIRLFIELSKEQNEKLTNKSHYRNEKLNDDKNIKNNIKLFYDNSINIEINVIKKKEKIKVEKNVDYKNRYNCEFNNVYENKIKFFDEEKGNNMEEIEKLSQKKDNFNEVKENINEKNKNLDESEKSKNEPINNVNYYIIKEETAKFFILLLLEMSIQYRMKEKKKRKKKYFNDFLNIISLYCKVNNVHQPLTLLHILSKKNDIFIFFYECIDKKIDIKTCQDIINLYTKNKHTKNHLLTFLNHVRNNVHNIIKFQSIIKSKNFKNMNKDSNNISTNNNLTLIFLKKIRNIFIGSKYFYNENSISFLNKTVLELLYCIIYNDFNYKNIQNVLEFTINNNSYYIKFYIYLSAYVQFIYRKNYSYFFDKKCKQLVKKKNEKYEMTNFKKYEKIFRTNFNTYNDFKIFLMFFNRKKEEYKELITSLKNIWFYLQITSYLLYLNNFRIVDINKLKFYTFIQNLNEHKVKRVNLFFDIMKKEDTTYFLIFFLLSNNIFNLLHRFLYIFYFNKPIVLLCNFTKCIKEHHFRKAEFYIKKHYNRCMKKNKNKNCNLYYIFFTHIINYLLISNSNIRYVILKMLSKAKHEYKYNFDFYVYKALNKFNMKKDIFFDIFDLCEELISMEKFGYIKKIFKEVYVSIDNSSKYVFTYNKIYIELNRFVLLHYVCFNNFLHIIKDRRHINNYIIFLYNTSTSYSYSNVIFLLFLLNYSFTYQSILSIFDQICILLLCLFLINNLKKGKNEKKKIKENCMFEYVKNKVLELKNLLSKKKKRNSKNKNINSSNLCILNFLPLNNEESENIFLFKEYKENRKKYMKYYKGLFPIFEKYKEYLNLREKFYNFSEDYFYKFSRNIKYIESLCINKYTAINLKLKVIYLLSLSTKKRIPINFDELNISYIESILKHIDEYKNRNTVVYVHNYIRKEYVRDDIKINEQLKTIHSIYKHDELFIYLNKDSKKNLLIKKDAIDHSCAYQKFPNNFINNNNSENYNENNMHIISSMKCNFNKNNDEKNYSKMIREKENFNDNFLFSIKKQNRNISNKENINILISIFICVNNLINNYDIIKVQSIINFFDIKNIYKNIKKYEREILKEEKDRTIHNFNSKNNNKMNIKKEKKKKITPTVIKTESCLIFDDFLKVNKDEKRYNCFNPLKNIKKHYIHNKKEIDVKNNLEIKLNENYDNSHLNIDDIYRYVFINSVHSLIIFYYLCVNTELGLHLMNLLYLKEKEKEKENSCINFESFIEKCKKHCSCDIYKFLLTTEILFSIRKKTNVLIKPIFYNVNNQIYIIKIFFYILKNFIDINEGTYNLSIGLKYTYLFNNRINTFVANLLIYHNFILLLLTNFHKYNLNECTNSYSTQNHVKKKAIKCNSKRNIKNNIKINSQNTEEKIIIYYECSTLFLNKYINLILTNSCNLIYKNYYFNSLLDVYFFILGIIQKKKNGKLRKKKKNYYCTGDIYKLLFNIKKCDQNFNNAFFNNLINFYKRNVAISLELEIEIIIFLYKLACKFTSQKHINKIIDIIKLRTSVYVKRRKLYLIFRILVNINEYDKLYFLFKLLFDSNIIYDFLKYSKNIFLSLNVYNYNCDLSISLNNNCLLYNQYMYKFKNYSNINNSKEEMLLDSINKCKNLSNKTIPNDNTILEHESFKMKNSCYDDVMNNQEKLKFRNLLYIIFENMYKKEKEERKEEEKKQINILYNFNNLNFSDLPNLYENYLHKFQNSSFLFYDDNLFISILSFYITIYCKQFTECDIEILTRIYKKIGLKYELYKVLKKKANTYIKNLKNEDDIFDECNLNTIITSIHLLHHCSLILLEIENLSEYNYNINLIYLLILQLKYIYLHNKQNLQKIKNSNFSSYLKNNISLDFLVNRIDENIDNIFENILQYDITMRDYKITFLNLSLDNLISLIEKHPIFYETLIIIKVYEKNYDDLVYSFIPKILFIQVVVYGNKKYLSDYCSYSCIDKNTLKYIIKLFQINSNHLKSYNSFPIKKYKYITIKKNFLTFDFSCYILSSINITYSSDEEKDKIFNYKNHVVSVKYILNQIGNIELKMKVCKKLGTDFNDLYEECKNILDLKLN
ncbi:conserved Plasmodium protein, unknown function [Plasmodium relictum]|uniref:Spatacsin C-terminal domain-containing protein n=1 Tax=Plasmodium relictum TaxID=85471 RepID=A0A1J1HCZ6_PLARL|nr:conserved Plasmodium protein, unknown function [Plasmodium relictum]CRH01293.1 conserved Plasmodium protein, unknown function [Plasmodium relictum]